MVEVGHTSEDERDEKDDVGGEDVDVPEGQPPFEDPFTAWLD